KLHSPAAGIVSKVDVQEGQIVPAGAPLVEIATGERIEVALGVEPPDALALKKGQAVELTPIGRATTQPVAGQIRVIGQRVDPTSRLVNVLVTLPAQSHLMLETFVAGKLTKATTQALLVPRGALLPQEDGGYALFTVKDGHAVKHAA